MGLFSWCFLAGRQVDSLHIHSFSPPVPPRRGKILSCRDHRLRSPRRVEITSQTRMVSEVWHTNSQEVRGSRPGKSRRWDELSQTTWLNAELWVWTASDWLLHCLYTQSVTTINLLIKSLYAITYSWTEDVRVARNVLHNISLSPTIPTIQFHTIFEFSNGITHLSGLF